MIIVGVDPGAKGGIAILNTYSYRTVECMALTHNTLPDIYAYLSEMKGGHAYDRYKKNKAQYAPRAKPAESLRRIVSPLPPKESLEEIDPKDNIMEMWLEEPGQIVVNRKAVGGDATKALLSGMTASRKLGRSVGQWEGIAMALDIPVVLVPPKRWQNQLDSKTGGDKNISKNRANSIFPFLTNNKQESTITHDVADALLIAAYGYLNYVDAMYTPKVLKPYIIKERRNGKSFRTKSARHARIKRSSRRS